MKLQHLILYNIGPFQGKYEINFESENNGNGYAFFAENNRGKTSIYNAMRWCLFGEVSGRAKTADGKRYEGGKIPIVGDGPRILMNSFAYENDKIQEMEVILIAEGAKGKIQITRAAKSTTTLARHDGEMSIQLSVKIGSDPIKQGNEAQEAIESIFPKELERFFFIDGEALEEYTEMMRSNALKGLKDEVNAVLGIPALTRGDDDLTRIRQGIKSKIDATVKAEKLSTKARDEAIKKKKELDEKRILANKKQTELNTVKEKLEETMKQIKSHKELAPIVEQLKGLESQIAFKKDNLVDIAKDKVIEAKFAWKVLLWKKGSAQYNGYITQREQAEQRDRIIEQANISIKQLKKDLKEMTGICDKCGQIHPNLEKFKQKKEKELCEQKDILNQHNLEKPDSKNDLASKIGDLLKLKPQDDSKERILRADKKWKKLVNELETLQEQHARLDAKLTADAKSNLEELGERKGRQDAMVARREQELRAAKTEVELAELELKRLVGKSGSPSVDKKDRNIDNILASLIVTIKDTVSSYREKARSKVEKRATEVFQRLNNAPEVYTGIRVDKEFKTNILNSEGRPARNPSSGAVSIMTISVIDALRHVSRLDLPVFLDTPGRSLDEYHKSKLLDYFWQTEGQQFLIFAHSGEYAVDETVEKFEGKLAKAYTISLPRDHKTCFQAECRSDDVEYDAYGNTRTCNACGSKWDLTSQKTLILEVPL
jgi:DNA sulfur modification protein DndD